MNYFKLVRVDQWVKNIVIFFPVLGFGSFQNLITLESIFIFILFSFFVSTTYIINDIVDIESDKVHPTKKNRIIASEKISLKKSKYIFILQLLVSSVSIYLINPKLFFIALSYFTISIFYSFFGKYMYFIDILSISFLFLIRLFFGSVFYKIELSLIMFLFIGFTSVCVVSSKKYSILNNIELAESKVQIFLLKSYKNKTLLYIYFSSISISTITFIYWIINYKLSNLYTINNFLYFLIFFIYLFFIFNLSKQTLNYNTEEIINLIIVDKSFSISLILILVIYIWINI